jgi:aspartyl/asparaginyl-tRNA synthetase
VAAAGTASAGARPALEKTYVRDLPKRLGQRVALYGWFNGMYRASGGRVLVIRDRTGTVPALYRGTSAAAEVDGLSPESAVRVVGTVRTGGSARFGAVQVDAESIDVLARAESPLPRGGPRVPAGERRHLDLRAREQFLVFEVQTTLEAAVREFLLASGFVEIHTPKVTAADRGSADPVLEVSYFGQSASLTQSPQAYLQLAMAAGFDRVFEVGPAFQADTADAAHQAAESTRLDLEVSWIDSPDELMCLLADLLRCALFAVQEMHGLDIERCFAVAVELPDGTIPRLPLSRALELIGRAGSPSGRLSPDDEQALCRYAYERHGHGYLFLTGYPAAERPFSAMRDEEPAPGGPAAQSRGFVLLRHGLEVAAGAQREHRYDRLRAQAGAAVAAEGHPPDWYFDMFRHGCPPHGGLGIGLNRLLMALLGRASIRDTSFVFRGPGRLLP